MIGMKLLSCAALLLVGALTLAWGQQPGPPHADPWWTNSVFYEIYPRSFQDTNGDGVGDLNGITRRLDYLQSLGINAIWITPCYPSPQVDFGYDVSDYENIDPQYGTLADFDRLIAQANKRHIRVLMDMVLNHTSDRHAWFQESRSDRTNPKSDWYIWRDGRVDASGKRQPPNNWLSLFGHSAWQWDPRRKQYYYHFFYAQQPDLNWRNPAVEKAMFAQMRFWLDRGVAGFRLDAVDTLLEDTDLRDSEVELDSSGKPRINAYGDVMVKMDRQANQPGLHDIIRRMRAMVAGYPGDRVLVGETYMPNIQELDRWYGGAAHDELQLPMDTQVGLREENGLNAQKWRQAINEAETQLDGNQPLLVIDNHDRARMDRFCTPQYGAAAGADCERIQKMLATVLLLSRDAALMYYGDEIGMATTPPARLEDVKDPIGRTGWPREKGRDGERTPMQWTAGRNAGFSSAVTTWLLVPPSSVTVNVQTESPQPESMLNYFRKLLAMRMSNPAMGDAATHFVPTSNDADILAWERVSAKGARELVMCNFSGEPRKFTLRDAALPAADWRVDVANFPAPHSAVHASSVELPAYGAIAFSIAPR